MKTIAVIPARYQSSRFPGKPLSDLCGYPMIWWVYNQVKKVNNIESVYVATDDQRILEVCKQYDLNAVMTRSDHGTSTERVSNASFISNEKRLASVYTNIDEKRLNLITSNLQDEFKIKALVFDYSSLLGEGDCADNAGAMLIRILKKCDVRKIYLAGFDGFDVDTSMNYFVTDFKTAMDYDAVRKKNDDISKQLKLALNEVKYELLTPSKYEI